VTILILSLKIEGKMPKVMIQIQLPFEIQEENGWFVSSCDILDVHSQGKTWNKAKSNLGEALFLFFLSCIERGTLDEVLKDCGFELEKIPPKRKEIKKPHLDVKIPFGIKQTSNSELCHA